MVSKPLRRTEVSDMRLNSVIIYATIYTVFAAHIEENDGLLGSEYALKASAC